MIAISNAMRDHVRRRAAVRLQRQIVVDRRRRIEAHTRLTSRPTRFRLRRLETTRKVSRETAVVAGEGVEVVAAARRVRVMRPND